jgi:hypothetical protein
MTVAGVGHRTRRLGNGHQQPARQRQPRSHGSTTFLSGSTPRNVDQAAFAGAVIDAGRL